MRELWARINWLEKELSDLKITRYKERRELNEVIFQHARDITSLEIRLEKLEND